MIETKTSDLNHKDLNGRPLNLAFLALLLIVIATLFGATTNMINGIVSEEYFRRIMGWEFTGIWKAAVLQGVFEGIIYGIIFSFIFTIGFAMITKQKADWKFAKKQLKKIILVIYGYWIVGGIIAIILAFSFPEVYDQLIYAVPTESKLRIGYAWVGGSIWGGIIGGIISVIYGLINTHKEWQLNINK